MMRIARRPAYSSTTWRDDFKRIVPEPDVILDCGANVGDVARAVVKALGDPACRGTCRRKNRPGSACEPISGAEI